MVDKKYIWSALVGEGIIVKCRPKNISKPTASDNRFLSSFFGDEDAKDTRWESYWENYFTTDYDDILNEDSVYNNDFDEAMKNITLTDDEERVTSDWSAQSYMSINYYAYNHDKKGFNSDGLMSDEKLDYLSKQVETLKELIDRTPNNPRNTHMFRVGFEPFDNLEVGEVYTQDGFASLTYSESYVDNSIETDKREMEDMVKNGYMTEDEVTSMFKIDYFVPSDTPGLYVAREYEDEYLTGPGTRYYCFEKDVDRGTAKVVILPR